jgi:hypothetical protein|tara:strand:- start:100 stop:204 length:105 start_codon:yes stop_codon:yes gene_type:complete
MRESMTDSELLYWAAYYEVKYEKEKEAIDRAKRK